MPFFNQKVIGLDISDHSLEVVEVARKGSKYKVLNSNRAILEAGLVERGKVLQPEELKKVLKNALETARPKPIKSQKAVFALPESHVFVHLFSLSDRTAGNQRLAKADLEQIVYTEAQKNIPLEENELLYHHRRRNKEKILIVAVNKRIVQEWNAFFCSVGLTIEFFDTETLAIYRGLFLKIEEEPVCIVDFGFNATNVLIYDYYGVKYAYAFPWGGSEIAKKIVRSMRISYEKAEQEMIEKGLSDAKAKVSGVLVKGLTALVEEIRASLDYYLKHAGMPVKKIIFVGGTSNLKGLAEHFQSHFDATVELGHSQLLGTKDPLPLDNFYIGAIGAARVALDKKWAERDPMIVLGKEAAQAVAPLGDQKDEPGSALSKKEVPFEKPKEKRFNVTIKFGQKGSVAEIKKSAVDEESKKRRLLDSELNTLKTVAPAPQPSKMRSRKITLCVVVIAGLILVGLAFLYRSYAAKQAGEERAERFQYSQFAQSQILTLKLPITLSSQDNNPEQIRGRIIEDVIVQAQDYQEALNLSRQNVDKNLQAQGSTERLWPEPLTLPSAEGAESLFPLAIKWLVYRPDDLEALVKKRIDLLNVNSVPYELQSIEERRIVESGDQNIYYLFIDATLALNELLPEEGEDLTVPDTQTGETVGETSAQVTEGQIEEGNVDSAPQSYVEILSTDLGWLRVRSGPGLEYTEIIRVHSGEKYPFLEEQNGWYKIKIDQSREGWVSGEYAALVP